MSWSSDWVASSPTTAGLTLMDQLSVRSKWSFLAALGAGCLVGASGVFLIQRLSHRLEWSHELTSQKVTQELTVLNNTIRDLQAAIQELKDQKSGAARPLRSALRSVTFSELDMECQARERPTDLGALSAMSSATSTTSTTEYFSAVSSDEEFFDVPTDSEVEDLNKQLNQAISSAASLSRSESSDPSHLELFPMVDQLMESHGEDQALALQMLRDKESEFQGNGEFLWRLCKAIYLKSIAAGLAGDNNLKKNLIQEAVNYGEAAIASNEASSEAHKWYAIVVGCRGEFVGIKEKILDGYEFKKHVDRAAELSPTDHTIQHLLGRYGNLANKKPEGRGKLCAAYDPSGAIVVCGGGERFWRPNANCWQLLEGNIGQWQEIPQMYPVHGAAVAFFKSKFWVLGGSTGDDSYDHTVTDKVQAYNPRKQEWSVETTLTSPRHKACAVSIEDHIVITGGTTLGLGKVKPAWLAEIGTRTAESFDGKKWSSLPSLTRAKVEHGCEATTISGQKGILVVGGATGDDLVEFLDWDTKSGWRTLGKLNRGRGMMPGIGFIGGKLSVIGGYSWPGGVDLIEQWDEDQEEWVKSRLKLKYPRYNHATITVPGEMFPKCVNERALEEDK